MSTYQVNSARPIDSKSLLGYLQHEHPDVYTEVKSRFATLGCDQNLMARIVCKVEDHTQEVWKLRHLVIATTLSLCSPETILSGARIRKGISSFIAQALGITHPSVNGRLEQVRHYYRHNAWTRDTVDQIVKEVRGNE